MTYCNVDCDQLLSILSQEDIDFATTVRIPYNGGAGLWARKHFIDEKIRQALADGVVQEVEREEVGYRHAGFYTQSDYIASGELKSMADGKVYDSKSKYYKSLKEQGMVIVDEPPKQRKEKSVDWEKALVETCNRVGI